MFKKKAEKVHYTPLLILHSKKHQYNPILKCFKPSYFHKHVDRFLDSGSGCHWKSFQMKRVLLLHMFRQALLSTLRCLLQFHYSPVLPEWGQADSISQGMATDWNGKLLLPNTEAEFLLGHQVVTVVLDHVLGNFTAEKGAV